MIKYCPSCGFEKENFEYPYCPECSKPLMVRQGEGENTQTVGADNSRKQASEVSLGMGAAVRGNITSNTSTIDNSTSNVVNNVTNIIREKSPAEIHEENVITFRKRCRALCDNGLFSKEAEKELVVLQTDFNLSSEEAKVLIDEEKKWSRKLPTELTSEGILRVKHTLNIITGNRQDALNSELNGLKQLKQEYNVEELDQLYYQLFAILTPSAYVAEVEKSSEEDYWKTYWAVVAYRLVGLNTKSEAQRAHLNMWNSMFPEQNKLLLASVVALMDSDFNYAYENFNALSVGYSKSLDIVFSAVKELLAMDWNRELALLPATSQFYYDTLFKEYCSTCRTQAKERKEEREREEKANQAAAEAEAARIAAEAETARIAAEMAASRQKKISEMLIEANALLDQKEYAKAMAKYREVADFDEGNSVAIARINEIGIILQQLFDDAMSSGNYAMKVGEYVEAIAFYKKALSIYPNDSIAISKLTMAEKKETQRQRAEWWHRNLKWFIIVAVLVVLAILGYQYIEEKKEERRKKEAQIEQERLDSIAEVNRKTWFKEQNGAFESFMSKPMNMNNAQQVINEGYGIMCPLCDTLDKYPSLSVSTSRVFIDRYNGRVDEAIEVVNEAAIDPNLSFEMHIEMDTVGKIIIDNIEQMRYKK